MGTHTTVPIPNLFRPHPNLSDEVNGNFVQSEMEGGVCLDELLDGAVLEVQTLHHWYRVVNCGQGEALISGHPVFCPDPVLVKINGSTWGGCMLKVRFIGRGMRLEFCHPTYNTITTSRILEIQEAEPGNDPRHSN